jgi:hypothetical protein
MSHIADKHFYDQIRQEMQPIQSGSSIVLYEWVGSGTIADLREFNAVMGIPFSPKMYDSLAVFLWYESQKTLDLFPRTIPSKNIDLPLSQIMKLYRDQAKKLSSQAMPAMLQEDMLELFEKNWEYHDYERKFFIALLNFMGKSSLDIEAMEAHPMRKQLLSIILHSRNEHIAKEIQKYQGKTLYAFYGALHFNGILEFLQKDDPSWKILSIDLRYPYVYK